MKSLVRSLDNFSFVEREKVSGKTVTNRCGRDFIYYGLHYLFPEKFNANSLSPLCLEKILGLALPPWLMWTQLQFIYLPKYLRENSTELYINTRKINTFMDFFVSIVFSRIDISNAIAKVEKTIDNDGVVGIDISLGLGGLLDHVMFVYGYDEDAFYVCDTHAVAGLEYTRVSSVAGHFMKLPKDVVRKRWTRFGRVWELKKTDK